MKDVIAAQIAFFEILHKHGVLGRYLKGELPEHVRKAASQLAASRFKGLPYNEKDGTIPVTPEEHDEALTARDQFLVDRGYAKWEVRAPLLILPKIIERGKKYLVKSGLFQGQCAFIKGTDKEIYGIPWIENFRNPACESFVFRIERDRLPLNGAVYVGLIGKDEILLHEDEIGDREQ